MGRCHGRPTPTSPRRRRGSSRAARIRFEASRSTDRPRRSSPPRRSISATSRRIGGEILGRDVARSVIQDDALRAKIAARGAPPSVADVALGFFRASRGGEFQAEDGTLERLIERPATPMRAVVAAKLAR